jgi:hypothetical protein
MDLEVPMKNIIYSPYATKAVAAGDQHHMGFRVVGCGEVPHESFYQDEWWYQPVDSESTIPESGLKRLEILKKAGIKIKGAVIAHEAPRLLCAPTPEPETKKHPSTDRGVEFDLLRVLGAVLSGLLMVLGIFLVAAIRIDPALIVVLEDDTWLEVMTWYE